MDKVTQKKKMNPIAIIGPLLLIALLFLSWKNVAFYEWIKALHIIAVISWMAGMLYLPRLFVYHAAEEPGSPVSEKFMIMEYKLLKLIINPAMMVTWACGLWLMFSGFVPMGMWLMVKLVLVLALSGFHGFLSKSQKRFATDENQINEKKWRLLNEVPTVIMIFVVILVVVKPF